MTKKPIILIVEDMQSYREIWKQKLRDHAEVVGARDIPEAREEFARIGADLALIVMDACVPGFEPNTGPLIQEFRQTFKGPIIACSSKEDFREILMQAGCDYQCSKDELPVRVAKILYP